MGEMEETRDQRTKRIEDWTALSSEKPALEPRNRNERDRETVRDRRRRIKDRFWQRRESKRTAVTYSKYTHTYSIIFTPFR